MAQPARTVAVAAVAAVRSCSRARTSRRMKAPCARTAAVVRAGARPRAAEVSTAATPERARRRQLEVPGLRSAAVFPVTVAQAPCAPTLRRVTLRARPHLVQVLQATPDRAASPACRTVPVVVVVVVAKAACA